MVVYAIFLSLPCIYICRNEISFLSFNTSYNLDNQEYFSRIQFMHTDHTTLTQKIWKHFPPMTSYTIHT